MRGINPSEYTMNGKITLHLDVMVILNAGTLLFLVTVYIDKAVLAVRQLPHHLNALLSTKVHIKFALKKMFVINNHN